MLHGTLKIFKMCFITSAKKEDSRKSKAVTESCNFIKKGDSGTGVFLYILQHF